MVVLYICNSVRSNQWIGGSDLQTLIGQYESDRQNIIVNDNVMTCPG